MKPFNRLYIDDDMEKEVWEKKPCKKSETQANNKIANEHIKKTLV